MREMLILLHPDARVNGAVLIDSFPIFRPFLLSAGETVSPGTGKVGPESVPIKERKKADENHSLYRRFEYLGI